MTSIHYLKMIMSSHLANNNDLDMELEDDDDEKGNGKNADDGLMDI